ncbi:MAG: hypothetical protein J1G02_04140 [Clostridiales bacterium]|nr:hypothetical protein [Clostridiales bacterium]
MQQWNKSQFQQQPQQDVYADIKTSYAEGFGQETQEEQEFSLSSIQERLGPWDTIEVQETVTTDDLRPSDQTLKMSYQREYAAQNTQTATKMNTKTKVAIASYAVVVLALIIAVTLCSVYVTGAFSSAALLNTEYSEVSSSLDDLVAATQEEDFAQLAKRAAELGYIDAANSTTMEYTELETRPAQNFHVESNWFDSLCDWLCGVFGG